MTTAEKENIKVFHPIFLFFFLQRRNQPENWLISFLDGRGKRKKGEAGGKFRISLPREEKKPKSWFFTLRLICGDGGLNAFSHIFESRMFPFRMYLLPTMSSNSNYDHNIF